MNPSSPHFAALFGIAALMCHGGCGYMPPSAYFSPSRTIPKAERKRRDKKRKMAEKARKRNRRA